MKKFIPFVFLVLFFACKKHNSSPATPSQWEPTSNYASSSVVDPVGFSIGGRLYIGMGSPNIGAGRGTQCVAYDTAANAWFQVSSFLTPTLVGSGFGLTIGGTGYVLLARDTLVGQLWAFDTAGDTWTRLADYPGKFDVSTIGFSVNGKAYVGFGDSADPQAFYQYDPGTGGWSAIADFPGQQAGATTSFVIGNYAYVGLGTNLLAGPDAGLYDQFYRYDPSANTWRGIAVFPGSQRAGGTGFTVGGKGYVVGGVDANSNFLKDVWQYDPVANTWSREADFPGAARELALGFGDSTNAYVGFGIGVGIVGLTDLWKFKP